MFIRIGKWISWIFPDDWNPIDNLGALSFYLFWIVAITGVYLFVFFETSIDGAWHSVEWISNEQYYIGSIFRGVHRFASAAMAVTVTVHLFREFVLKRYVGPRWFSWISGVPLLWLLFASALGGYWLVWDEKAQYIALTTAKLFDTIPIVVEPMAFGFLSQSVVSDRFFSLLIFLHVGVPLFLLLGMFVHIQRINHSKSMPSRGLAVVVLVALIVLSLVMPATSMPQANLDKALGTIEMDWFYMNFYPLIDMWGPNVVWGILGVITFGLCILPFVVPSKIPVAKVDPEFCNGCSWCYADCPFDAIYMKPHDYKKKHRQAVVIEDRCVGCGICAGACPSVTPFKHFNEAKSGIDLEGHHNFDVLDGARNKVRQLTEEHKILIVGCNHGPDIKQFEDGKVVVESLECIGQLPPSYMDFLCRREDVDAVLLTGCRAGGCYHRLGIELQEERLVRLREPHLKYADVGEKIEKMWVGKGGEKAIASQIEGLKKMLDEKRVDCA
jgi:quinol-cytochrome oxidoreductase complex cytochrome b subunit/coenzyme F420-reducing hydrogenase delta subunit